MEAYTNNNQGFDRLAIEQLLIPAPSSGNSDRRVVQKPLAEWPVIDAAEHDISYGALENRTMTGVAEDRDSVLGVAILDFRARLNAVADPEAFQRLTEAGFDFKVPVVVTRAVERFGGDVDLYKRTDGLRFFPIGIYSDAIVPTFPLFTPTGDQKKEPSFYVTDYGREMAVEAKKELNGVKKVELSAHEQAERLAWAMAGHPLS
jgi:hypothetical protein